MLEQKIKSVIKEVPDFPKPGISFKDITPLLLEPTLVEEILEEMMVQVHPQQVEAVAGVESRGFLFGLPLAIKLGVPFIPLRKAGKLPRATLRETYALEYGEASIELHAEDISPGQRVLIHDDLLATGGTAKAAASLLQKAGAEICGFHFLVSLLFLSGADVLTPIAGVKQLVAY